MLDRSVFDVEADERALLEKLRRVTTEYDQLKTRPPGDAGVTKRMMNLQTSLERGADQLAELRLERRDALKSLVATAPPGALESGDGAADPHASPHSVKTVFGRPAEPWLPGIGAYRKMHTKAVGTAGAFIPVEYAGSFFDLLRKRTAVLAAGPVMLPVSSAGSVRVPRVTTSVTIAGIAEHAVIPPVDPGLGDITLDPMKFGALTLVSREAVEDSSPQLREVVAQTLLRDLAVELDKQLVAGPGTAGTLRGLRNIIGLTAGPPLGANGASLTFGHLADTASALENQNADFDRAAWIMHSRTWGSVRKLQDTQGRPLVAADPTLGVQRSLFGRPVFISNSLSVAESVGTSTDCSVILFVDMSQVVVAVARELEVLYDESYAFNTDQVAVKATCRYDLGSPNPAAIVLTTGVRV